jgi:hypothetical protein
MSKKNEPINTRVTRLQVSRYEREQQQRRIIVIGALVVGAITLLLVAAALLQLLVFEPQRVVASVGGQNITASDVQKRMRYDQGQFINQFNRLSQQASQAQQSTDPSAQFLAQFYQQQMQQMVAQGSADAIARGTLDGMIDRALIRQEATRRGISVAADDVQKELENSYGFYRQTLTPFPTDTPLPPATVTPIPTIAITGTAVATTTQPTAQPAAPIPTNAPRLQPTSIREDEYRLLYQQTLDNYKSIGLSEAELRAIVEDGLLSEKVRKAFADETPKRAQHFKFDYVRFKTEADATKALDRLSKNEIAFPALISETNAITQPAPIGNGLSVDWLTVDNATNQYGDNIVAALGTKSIGAPTGVITSADGGFYVLLPLGREERELSASDLESAQQRRYSDWLLKAQNDATRVTRIIDPTTLIPSEVRTAADQFMAQFGGATGQ